MNIGTALGDTVVTTKDLLKESKKSKVECIGKIRKNIKVEYFGKKVKIKELFKKDMEENKFKSRTISGINCKYSQRW